MSFYYLTFKGSYLGGRAIVQAGDERHALETLCNNREFKALPDNQQEDLIVERELKGPVLDFWDGDY